jgi:hypothetical protein
MSHTGLGDECFNNKLLTGLQCAPWGKSPWSGKQVYEVKDVGKSLIFPWVSSIGKSNPRAMIGFTG